jgi:hypothetical protein
MAGCHESRMQRVFMLPLVRSRNSSNLLKIPEARRREAQLLRHRMSRWPVLAVALASLLLVIGMSQLSIGQAVLKNVGLVGSPGAYTSMAFQNPQDLPTQLGRLTIVKVAFEISNATTSSNDYRWNLLLLKDARNRRVSTGDVRVSPGQTVSVTRSVRISCEKDRVRITVMLAQPNEHIDAWMTCKA